MTVQEPKDQGVKSRIHPKYKIKNRGTNWSRYDKDPVQRGDITFWISDQAIAAWTPKRSGKCGAPHKYSDLAIETGLALWLVNKLPLTQRCRERTANSTSA